MNIDVVLTASAAVPPGPGRVLVASTAQQLVQHIRSALGPGGRIDRLRIVDSFDGAGMLHPLGTPSALSALRGLFNPQGSVEIVPGTLGVQATAGGQALVAGFNGGFGGFGGSGKLMSSIASSTPALMQISTVLGVPVRSAR